MQGINQKMASTLHYILVGLLRSPAGDRQPAGITCLMFLPMSLTTLLPAAVTLRDAFSSEHAKYRSELNAALCFAVLVVLLHAAV
jgi:hypothetical protein